MKGRQVEPTLSRHHPGADRHPPVFRPRHLIKVSHGTLRRRADRLDALSVPIHPGAADRRTGPLARNHHDTPPAADYPARRDAGLQFALRGHGLQHPAAGRNNIDGLYLAAARRPVRRADPGGKSITRTVAAHCRRIQRGTADRPSRRCRLWCRHALCAGLLGLLRPVSGTHTQTDGNRTAHTPAVLQRPARHPHHVPARAVLLVKRGAEPDTDVDHPVPWRLWMYRAFHDHPRLQRNASLDHLAAAL